jgi:hypothetical protein
MSRKVLAALLVIACTLLAGFDLLEDLNSLARIEIATSDRASGFLHIGNVVNDIVESADQSRFARASFLEPCDRLSCSAFAPTPHRTLKIYKLQQIFLI